MRKTAHVLIAFEDNAKIGVLGAMRVKIASGENCLYCPSDGISWFWDVWFNVNGVIFDVSGCKTKEGLEKREISTFKDIRTKVLGAELVAIF